MKNKGFTLIEVIVAISLIGLIAVSFLPMMTFGYKNIVDSQKFTTTLYDYQQIVENKIESLRDSDPGTSNFITIYGKKIYGHKIQENTSTSGVVNVFIPKRRKIAPVPVIEAAPKVKVRKLNIDIEPQPTFIDLFSLENSLFVDEIKITSGTKDNYLMSVYRWYVSSERDNSTSPSPGPNEYFVLKEWNEAKKQLSFAESINLKFIPNIKDSYNLIKLNDVKTKLALDNESFISTLGNRYIKYSVTPFSVAGRMGEERFSNPIYIKAPRIEIQKAVFSDDNKIFIYFKDEIAEAVDMSNIKLNGSIGEPDYAYRDSGDYKRLVLEFNTLDKTSQVEGNRLIRGAVKSVAYNDISIWYNNVLDGEFPITLP